MTTPILRPIDNPEAAQCFRIAQALSNVGRDDDAISHVFRAIALEPELAMARLLLGEILLRRGEYRAGWLEYEFGSRWAMVGPVAIRAPQWNGMRLGPGTLLLVGSQGFGDVIQFARFIPLAAERCGQVVVGCGAEVASLLAAMPGVAQVFTTWDKAPPFAAYSPLTSLPNLFGTEVGTIPAAGGYLAADPVRAAVWRERLGLPTRDGRRQIGIVWAGRPAHPNDRRRSMTLDDLSPLLDLPGVRCVAIQQAASDGDRAALEARGHVAVGRELSDFADTAALIEALDLVVTVDTSVAHLAGALGKPVWILLPFIPDWRWLTRRSDSPWYASARLFRQEAHGDWATPVSRVVHELERQASESVGKGYGRTVSHAV